MLGGMNGKEFSEWLYAEMERRGLSQSELARRAGMAQSTVSFALSGDRRPGLDFCVGVARAFDLPPEDVLQRAGLLPSSPEETPNAKLALHLFSQLPVEVQDLILAQMRALVERESSESTRGSVAAQTREASKGEPP